MRLMRGPKHNLQGSRLNVSLQWQAGYNTMEALYSVVDTPEPVVLRSPFPLPVFVTVRLCLTSTL